MFPSSPQPESISGQHFLHQRLNVLYTMGKSSENSILVWSCWVVQLDFTLKSVRFNVWLRLRITSSSVAIQHGLSALRAVKQALSQKLQQSYGKLSNVEILDGFLCKILLSHYNPAKCPSPSTFRRRWPWWPWSASSPCYQTSCRSSCRNTLPRPSYNCEINETCKTTRTGNIQDFVLTHL